MTSTASLAALCVAGLLCIGPQGVATAQTPRPLAALEGVWEVHSFVAFERAADVETDAASPDLERALLEAYQRDLPDVRDPDYDLDAPHELVSVLGQKRTATVTGLSKGVVPFTDLGSALSQLAEGGLEDLSDNPEERALSERCIEGAGRAPFTPSPFRLLRQIVVTAGDVLIVTEDVGAYRVIHLDGGPADRQPASFAGYSTGRVEGEALIVETSRFRADKPFRDVFGRPLIVGRDSRIIERLERVSEDELLYQFTILDPLYYATPWSAEFSMRRTSKPMFEYACHESNYSMKGILLGDR